MKQPSVLLLLLGALALPACKASKADATPPVRPVLSTVVSRHEGEGASFVGSIQPRYATQLAFRVGGRIVRRAVSVGDHVKRGDEIASLDVQTLRLTVTAAQANVAGLTARSTYANSMLERQTDLLAHEATPQATFDNAQTSHDTVVAAVAEAEARLAKAREDLSYGVLRADFDGVVTRVDFEVEQTVAPNLVIAELARPDVLDDVFDVPEAVARDLEVGDTFTIRNAAPPFVTATGKVRQISPAADRATRTRRVWVALDDVPVTLRLGTTTYAERRTGVSAPLRVPLTSLLEQGDKTSVWIVDGDVVQPREVTLTARSEKTATIASGIREGERVLTAGVHSVSAGQRVKVGSSAEGS